MYTVKDILPSAKISLEEPIAHDELKLNEEYELEKCTEWVKQRNVKRVCVQFSQDKLHLATQFVHILERNLNQKLFLLGDTSYGNCCIDEVAAQHVNADGIIHVGHTCLSPSTRIPILYIFNKEKIDIDELTSCFQKTFNFDDNILLLYDVSYHHVISDINHCLKNMFKNLNVAELSIEGKLHAPTHTFFGRDLHLSPGTKLNEYLIVFIGNDGPCVANFKYLFPNQSFYLYTPVLPESMVPYEINISKFLQRRMFFIESLKSAKNLGILIGTLCVKNYLKAIERIKCLTKPRGIKCYIISVGRINVAKLANFPEMDAYVLISCAESSLMNSKEFLQPIVTPYEVELAFNAVYKWSEKYITDFTTLLPGCVNYVQENLDSQENETNVSLISGNLPNTLMESSVPEDSVDSIVAKGIGTLALAESHGCNFLTSRTWVGLEPKLGQTVVEQATPGRSGIPYKYKNESVD